MDESTQLLDKILEYSQLMDVVSGDQAEAGGVIADMLGTFSAFAAAGVALVMVYMWSVAVMHTAWEGEALGQRFSTLWTPIRSVMAVVFVAPFPGLGGLSVMMAIILVLVGTSIQGANTLYGSVLDYFESNDGTILPNATDDAYPDDALLRTALLGETCMAYYNEVTGAIEADGPSSSFSGKSFSSPAESRAMQRHTRTVSKDNRKTLSIQYGSATEGMETCGAIRVTCPETSTGDVSPICDATLDATQVAVSEGVIGGGVPAAAASIYNGTSPDVATVADQLQGAVTGYEAAWISSISSSDAADITLNYDEDGRYNGTYTTELTDDQQGRIESFTDRARDEGWLSAGKWYWNISAMSHERAGMSKSSTSTQQIAAENIPEAEENFRPAVERLSGYLGDVKIKNGIRGHSAPLVSDAGDAAGGDSSYEGEIGRLWDSSVGTDFHVMTSLLTDGDDPIRTLAGYGQGMITASGSLLTGIAAVKMASGAGDSTVLSTITLGGSSALASVGSFVASIATVGAAWLFATGGMLAYYVPVIPLMYWILAVLGWVTAVIGSLLAAQLWAASHAVPEGEGFAGRYALQGWQLLLNVVLRPILLTISVIIAIFVMQGIVFFALESYAVFNDSLVSSTTSWTAIAGILFTNLIMVILVITVSHKAHELIYNFADEVMRWIGFGVQPLGSVQNEGDIRQQVKSGMGTTERMTQAGVGRLSQPSKGGDGAGDSGGGSRSGGGTPRIAGGGSSADVAGGSETPGDDGRDGG